MFVLEKSNSHIFLNNCVFFLIVEKSLIKGIFSVSMGYAVRLDYPPHTAQEPQTLKGPKSLRLTMPNVYVV